MSIASELAKLVKVFREWPHPEPEESLFEIVVVELGVNFTEGTTFIESVSKTPTEIYELLESGKRVYADITIRDGSLINFPLDFPLGLYPLTKGFDFSSGELKNRISTIVVYFQDPLVNHSKLSVYSGYFSSTDGDEGWGDWESTITINPKWITLSDQQ